MKYTHILAEFCTRAWAIREETLAAMTDLIRLQVTGVKWDAAEIQERIAASNEKNGTHAHAEPQMRMLEIVGKSLLDGAEAQAAGAEARSGDAGGSRGTIALIPIIGIVSHRMNLMSSISGPGGTSIQKLTAQFRQAMEDGNCKAIVFDIDSPGGSVEGVMELAAEIYQGRKQKKIVAVCNSMACSAAYWLGSAAGEMVCTPSGQCGSIGVYMVHQDESAALEKEGIKITMIKAGKYKTEGDPSQPLSDEALQAFQAKVNSYYGMFVKAVAQNRGTSQEKVREGYGEGRSLLAQDALKAKLVDRVATLDEVLGKFGVKSGATSQYGAQSDSSTEALSSRNAKLKARTNPDNPDDPTNDDEDDYCGHDCSACQGCTGYEKPAASRVDDDMSCTCACDACKACTSKGAQSELITPAPDERKKSESAAAGEALAAIHRRRQQQIDLMRL